MKIHYTYIKEYKNKKYYGVRTSNGISPEEDIKYYYSGSKIMKDICKKYPNSINNKIDKIFKTRLEAEQYEGEYLKNIPLKERKKWYNINFEENGKFSIYNPNKKIREKLSQSKKGEKNSFYGKKHSEESRKKMSESKKGEKNSFYGRKHSKESKLKMKLHIANRKIKKLESIIENLSIIDK